MRNTCDSSHTHTTPEHALGAAPVRVKKFGANKDEEVWATVRSSAADHAGTFSTGRSCQRCLRQQLLS